MEIYVAGALLFAGIPGNILCVIVLTRTRLKRSPASSYMVTLAISDMLSLLVGLGTRHWIRAVFGVDTTSDNDWWCKLWFYILTTLTNYTNWVLMALSVDRCIAVMAPVKAKN